MSPFGLSPGNRHWLREGSEQIGAGNIEKSVPDVKPREEVAPEKTSLNPELEAKETSNRPFIDISIEVSLENHFKGHPR